MVARRAARILTVAFALAASFGGCVCRRSGGDGARPSGDPSASASAQPSAPSGTFEMQLARTALVTFGNSTPLPLSQEFTEDVPGLGPPLERVAAARGDKPIRLHVEREVNFGQLTRLLQAGIGARIGSWEITATSGAGTPFTFQTPPPGPFPRGDCWTRIWIGPDRRAQLYLDGHGVIVRPRDGNVDFAGVIAELHRLDAKCLGEGEKAPDGGAGGGQVRLYTQPSAPFGPVLDLARAIVEAEPKPHVRTLHLQVPSLNALDSPEEIHK